jgi:iron complex transport system substrate-binding protein
LYRPSGTDVRRLLILLVVLLAVGPALAGAAAVDDPAVGPAQVSDEQTCEFPVEVEDATGETIVIEEEPARVVTLQANAAQHMWSIGAKDKVVGMPVQNYTGYLNGSEDRTGILAVGDSGFLSPDIEQVIELEPDLVLAPDITGDTAADLRAAGITVYQYPAISTFEQMYSVVEDVGKLVGACEAAPETTTAVEETVDTIGQAVEDQPAPDVYYEFSQFTAAPGAIEHEVITRAGGNNIVREDDFDRNYGQLSDELIIQRDPEFLILQEGAPIPDSEAIRQTTAVQEDQIIRINPDFMSQHGPRTVEPLQTIAEGLFPEAVAEATNDTASADESTAGSDSDSNSTSEGSDSTSEGSDSTSEGDDEPSDTEPTPESDSDDGGPGLTVVAAAAAIAAVTAVLARRR